MIEVFADIWCPFAYVGLQIVRARRDQRAPQTAIAVRAWPLELVNGKPMDVGKTRDNVRELRSQLGIELFAGFNPDHFPTTTLMALAAVTAAARVGRGEDASFRAREALWEEGRDIGDPRVADALASEFGVSIEQEDRRAVLADWHDGEARGVIGSPHFFCGGRDVFCPSLSLERDDAGQLHIAPDPSRLEQFLDACWS